MIKIATIGPESSGKTTICETLAKHYNGFWFPEYARDYLTNVNGYYEFNDLETMAQDQYDLWQLIPDETICFYDTEMINYKIWSLEKYGICSKVILGLIDIQQFDLYILCKPDIEYISDPLRDFPDYKMREKLFNIYKTELDKYGFNYCIIEGNYNDRTNLAIEKVSKII